MRWKSELKEDERKKKKRQMQWNLVEKRLCWGGAPPIIRRHLFRFIIMRSLAAGEMRQLPAPHVDGLPRSFVTPRAAMTHTD